MQVSPPSERVLSTLNLDGSRHVIRPKLARGRFLRRRRIVGYALIALFVALPFVRIGGRPAFLIDLITREVSIVGAVFRPTDGFVLMMLGISIAIAVFLVTAMFGRVWCGWGCPQTVYLELVFRPIERWIEGSPAQQRALDAAPGVKSRRVLKWIVYAAISFVLANVFLAYFVGTDRLATWVLESPGSHPGGFMVVLAVAGLVLFDFGYFREQACIVACPYGRLQSVLLDRQSLVVGYDARRGEPRGMPKKRLPVIGGAGDCVDCSACVAVCPTGIDIRQGLQMECIGCAQCIDACDAVMTKLHKPLNLIGYTSQDQLAGIPRRGLRARTIVYPALLALTTTLLVWSASTRAATLVWVERHQGPSFVDLPDGRVAAQIRIKLENQTDATQHYTFALVDAPDAALRTQPRWEIAGRRSLTVSLYADIARATLVRGRRIVHVKITDGAGTVTIVEVTLLGPAGLAS